MAEKQRNLNMLVSTIIMGIFALILLLVAYHKGELVNGVKLTSSMVLSILPLLFFAFIIAGMVQVILPHELLSKWIGAESGMRGIFIGTIAGALTPGGPYVSLPIVAGLLRSGASVGAMVAYLTAWSLWAFTRLPMEVGILGWKFTLIRIISVIICPTIAGLIAQMIAKVIK